MLNRGMSNRGMSNTIHVRCSAGYSNLVVTLGSDADRVTPPVSRHRHTDAAAAAGVGVGVGSGSGGGH